jgi:glucose/arabinose dehydrogenase
MLKKTVVATAPGGSQPGQVVGVPGEANIVYVLGHKNGNVYILQDGKLSGTPLTNVQVAVNQNSEQGLLGMTLHPNFASNHLFYLFYTAQGGAMTIDEFERMTPTTAMKKQNIYSKPRAGGGTFHNGGSIYFNPKDGDKPLLYLAVGNNLNKGESGKPDGVAGRVLRFDLATKTPTTVAYGLRNPYRMSIDRLTGDMWIGDVSDGPGGSVFFLPHDAKDGTNFGYPAGEVAGGISGRQGGSAAIIGGVVYRGSKIAGLCGRYFFGMHNPGSVRSMIQSGGKIMGGVVNHPELSPAGNLTSFGEDGEGELYFTSMAGTIYKIESAGGQ